MVPVFQKGHRQRRKKTPQEGRSAEKWEAVYLMDAGGFLSLWLVVLIVTSTLEKRENVIYERWKLCIPMWSLPAPISCMRGFSYAPPAGGSFNWLEKPERPRLRS